MPRYQGVSPFQSVGLVWTGVTGILLLTNNARTISVKPVLPFPFDALYAEPGLCHRLYQNEEFPLNQDEINAVMQYIQNQDGLGELVNGVTADGRYVEAVEANSVVRTVNAPPPTNGTWRFDFTKGDGDHWYQPPCVDAQGNYLGNVPESNTVFIANTAYPTDNPWGEQWKWSFSNNNWYDSRTLEEQRTHIRNVKKATAWGYCNELMEISTVNVAIGNTTYEFHCDRDTRENIMAINTAVAAGINIPNPRPYYPKGYTTPVMFTHADFALIGVKLMEKKDQLVYNYMEVKAVLDSLTDINQLKEYDITAQG